WSKVIERSTLGRLIRIGALQNTRRERPLIITGHDKSRQTASCSRSPCPKLLPVDHASRSGNRNRVEQAGPEIGEVSVFLRRKAVVLPPHARVQRESRTKLEVVLNKRAEVDYPACVFKASICRGRGSKLLEVTGL